MQIPSSWLSARATLRRAATASALVAMIASLAACPPRRKEKQRELPPITQGEPVAPRAPSGDAIEYTLRFPAPHTHYVEVEAVYPTGGADSIELMMAVWTPGSYLVREYARHIDAIRAYTAAGEPLAIEKTRKNRWTVQTGGAERVVARYQLYCREMSVRTNFVDADMAMLNGAPTFVTLVGGLDRPHDVQLELPKAWKDSAVALPAREDNPHRYLAPDYDTLVDSPILLGNLARYPFEIQGVPHELINVGEQGIWDGPRSARDTEAIARAHIALWRTVPYKRYLFMNVIGGGGGLEHKSSTLMLSDPWSTRTRKNYLEWLGLVSHEFFHTWNVKRMRPQALGPFDYEAENYTPSLWIAEGITSYYDDLLLARAGLMKRKELLESLSKQIEEVESIPGSRVQPLRDSSYDTWIKFYRPDENSDNVTTSYYRKGAVVAFLLDAEIRRATLDERSLDDVMRLAYERYAGERGYTTEQFRAIIDEVAGRSLATFMTLAVDTAEPLDYQPALDYYGLRFAPVEGADGGDGGADKSKDAKASGDGEAAGQDGAGQDGAGQDDTAADQDGAQPGAAGEGASKADDETPGWLGLDLGSGAIVFKVPRDTPAYAAGINVGDEILAIDQHRVRAGDLGKRLAYYRPGDEISVLVSRRGQLRRIDVKLAEKPKHSWTLEVIERPSALQKRRLDALLASQPLD